MRRKSSHAFLFYSESLHRDQESVLLAGDEHHHLSRVLRTAVGDEVFVTNGRGLMLKCRLLEKGTRWTRLGVVGVEAERDGQRDATLALACIRKDAYEQAVAQCTELGVSRFVPFTCEKAGIKGYSPTFINRLRRIAKASMKQAFSFTLPDIDAPIPFEALAAHIEASRQIFVGEQHAPRPKALKAASPLLLIIGPEGGFVEGERACLERQGCSFVSAGRNRLRSETAAVALASLVLSGSEGA